MGAQKKSGEAKKKTFRRFAPEIGPHFQFASYAPVVFYGTKDVFPRQLRPFCSANKKQFPLFFSLKNAKFPIPSL